MLRTMERRIRNRRPALGSWTGALALAFLATALLVYWSLVPRFADSPRYWLLWLGERILSARSIPDAVGAESPAWTGHRWLQTEWLYALAAAAAARAHLFPLFAALSGVCASAPLWWSLFFCVKRRVRPLAVFLLVLACAALVTSMYGIRASAAGIALTFASLALLESRRYALLPLLFALWVNVHASFIIGIAFFALVVLRETFSRRFQSILPFAAALCATLFNPYGIALWPYAIAMTHAWYGSLVEEWTPTFVALPLAGVLIAASLAAFIPGLRRRTRLDRLSIIALPAAVAGLFAVRNAALGLAVAGSIALANARSHLHVLRMRPNVWAAAAACALLFVRFGELPSYRWGFTLEPRFGLLASNGSPGIALQGIAENRYAYCDAGPLCDAVLLLGGRTLYDGRNDAFPAAALPFADGLHIHALAAQRKGADEIIVNRAANIRHMLGLRGWHLARRTPAFFVFEQNGTQPYSGKR